MTIEGAGAGPSPGGGPSPRDPALRPPRVRGPSPDDPTIGRLVADASRDISTLLSKEIELAKSELKVSVRSGGIGAGLLAGAAFIAVLGVIMLSFTIVYFINWGGAGLAL